MELTDFQVYLALIVGTGASVTFGISGIKWAYHRWVSGIDSRIITKVCSEVSEIREIQGDHTTRIKSLEDRFNDFWRYLRGPSNEQ